jgi:hypothetical protein
VIRWDTEEAPRHLSYRIVARNHPLMLNQAAGDCWVAGVDGCPAGWMVAFARVKEGEGSAELRLLVLPQFADARGLDPGM